MKIRYYIPRKDEKKCNIMMSVAWEGNQIRRTSGYSINVKDWNFTTQRCKSAYRHSMNLNSNLDTLKTNIINAYLLEKNNKNNTTKENIEKIIAQIVNPDKNLGLSFYDLYKEFIAKREATDEFHKRTIQRYKTALNHLIAFEHKTRWKCSFETMNEDFLLNFKKYLHNKEKRMVDNSIKTIIRTIKIFLKWALRNGYHSNVLYKDELRMEDKETFYIALSIDELKIIEEIELSSKRFDEIRDIFLLICYTCLRYSDVYNLDIANFDFKNEELLSNQEKKEEIVRVPFHPKLKQLLLKYPDNSFPKISEQKFNDYIKEVFKEAEFDDPVPIYKFYGPNTVKEIKPKYKLIASNTARRTFMTLLYNNNVHPKDIMKYSGHSDERSFFRYIRVDERGTKERVLSAWNKMYGN